MKGPLEGYRVVDLTTVLFGPYATQIMGDMGADIVKVEPPIGESNRQVGPAKTPGMSAQFMVLNRNKRSIMLDLAKPEGLAALKRLVESADVFVHNMRPRAVRKLGIDYDAIAAVKPDIVYCSTIGYGSKGPYKDRPAYDDLVQGASGIAALQARHLGGDPRYVGTVVADKTGGLTALYAILMGLLHRERTGEGQNIEVPMFESLVSYALMEHLYGRCFEPAIGGMGYDRVLSRNRKPYRTKDGHVCALPYTDKHWRAFFGLAGRPELADDPRFSTMSKRTENIEELYAMVDQVMQNRTTEEWLAALEEADIPFAPVNDLPDLLEDPHLKAVDFFPMISHPTEGELRMIGIPIRMSKTPGAIRTPPAHLGEHSVEVLAEAGFGADEIDALIAAGVTRDGRPA